MTSLQVRPCEEPGLAQLRSVFTAHYSGCEVRLENTRRLPHTGLNSDLVSVEVRVTGDTEETEAEVRVGVMIKTQGDKTKGLGRCRHTRFMTREVVFYTKILPAIIRSVEEGTGPEYPDALNDHDSRPSRGCSREDSSKVLLWPGLTVRQLQQAALLLPALAD